MFAELENIGGKELAEIIIIKSIKIIISLLVVGLAVHNALKSDFDLLILLNLIHNFKKEYVYNLNQLMTFIFNL